MAQTAVVLVEDDPAVREYFAEALRGHGVTVTALPLAVDLFQALRAGLPDVIVMDLGMPPGTMQGMEVLTRMRDIEAWRHIPVIIMSAFGDIVNRDLTARLGVVAVLAKPLIDVDQLVTTIRAATAR